MGKLKRTVDEMVCVISLIRAVPRHEPSAGELVFLTRSSRSLDAAVLSIISRDYSKLNLVECVSVLILFLSKPSENVIYKVEEGDSLRRAGKDHLLLRQFKESCHNTRFYSKWITFHFNGLV